MLFNVLQTMMRKEPETLHALLRHLTQSLIVYVGYQIDSGKIRQKQAFF